MKNSVFSAFGKNIFPYFVHLMALEANTEDISQIQYWNSLRDISNSQRIICKNVWKLISMNICQIAILNLYFLSPGLDNAFVILNSWHRSDKKASVVDEKELLDEKEIVLTGEYAWETSGRRFA